MVLLGVYLIWSARLQKISILSGVLLVACGMIGTAFPSTESTVIAIIAFLGPPLCMLLFVHQWRSGVRNGTTPVPKEPAKNPTPIQDPIRTQHVT